MAKEIDPETLQYIVNHVFLPPQLPQASNENLDHETGLINVVLDAAKAFNALLPDDDVCKSIISMVTDLSELRDNSSSINEAKLKATFEKLVSKQG